MRSAYFPIDRGLHRERESKREREAISICQMVKTQKWYYLHHTRSAYFPVNRRLCVCVEREQEREAMSIHKTVKTEKWYYLCNTRSAYFPIDRRLHRERDTHRGERERERERERQRERGRERERERKAMSIHETVKTQKQYYLHNKRSAYFPFDRGLHRESKRERGRLCPSMKW